MVVTSVLPFRPAADRRAGPARRRGVDLTAAEPIATALGGLPLALSHAAAYLRENENATARKFLEAIAEHMRDAPEVAECSRPVFATFQEQADQAERRAPGARAILSLAAFYASEDSRKRNQVRPPGV
jgi:hypothetical protein